MSVFNRIAGTEEPKIPVWPIICDFTRMMDNELSLSQLGTIYNLSQAELAECTEYAQGLAAMLADETTERLRVGWGQAFADGDARSRINALIFHLLLRTEQGTLTEAQFRARLGLV
jgi:hypothetical protein